jgi:hypothetical protein
MLGPMPPPPWHDGPLVRQISKLPPNVGREPPPTTFVKPPLLTLLCGIRAFGSVSKARPETRESVIGELDVFVRATVKSQDVLVPSYLMSVTVKAAVDVNPACGVPSTLPLKSTEKESPMPPTLALMTEACAAVAKTVASDRINSLIVICHSLVRRFYFQRPISIFLLRRVGMPL